ncbi:hypothetical protein GCM10023212_31520 [Luteolibacter yonseiensis]
METVEGELIERMALAGKTDGAGELKIPIRPEWRVTEYLTIHLVVKHALSGYGAVSRQIPPANSSLEIRLTQGLPLRFRLLDEKRTPISNLRLRVVRAQIPVYSGDDLEGPKFWGRLPLLPAGFWNAVTDGNGRCSIEGLPAGLYFVDHDNPKYEQIPGHNHQAFQYRPEEKKGEIELQLNPAVTVWGTVLLPDGTPVSGAKVNILENSGYVHGGVTAETLTDAKGRYELQRLIPADYALQVRLNDKLKADWTADPTELNLKTGEFRKEVNPNILEGGLITGKITLSDTGAAVGDMLVCVVSPKDSLPLASWTGRTDRSGGFQIRVPAGMRKVYLAGLVPDGYSSANKDTNQLSQSVEVENGGTYTADFALPRESRISGLVVNESGQPVAGANVTCVSPTVSAFGPPKVVTDAAGKFSIDLPAGIETAGLLAESDGLSSPGGATYPVGSDVKLVLMAGGFASASGRVVDVEGKPIAGAMVHWNGTEAAGVPVKAITDKDGRFQTKKVIPGKQIIFYGSKNGYGSNSSFAGFKAGQAVELEPILLYPADATMTGKVVDASGNPVSGAKVQASGEFQTRDATAISDSDGKFVLRGLVKGWLFVQATKRSQGEFMFHAEVRVRTGGGDVVVKPSDRPAPWERETLIDFVGKPAPPLKAQSWFHSAALPESRPGKVRLISIVGLDRPLKFSSNILPQLQRFREEIQDQELEIIVVHGAWPREEVAEFLASDFPDFKLPVAIESEKEAMSKAFGAQYWLTVVINQEGQVVFQNRGEWNQAKKKVRELLGKAK